jgi:hypothetical protein
MTVSVMAAATSRCGSADNYISDTAYISDDRISDGCGNLTVRLR